MKKCQLYPIHLSISNILNSTQRRGWLRVLPFLDGDTRVTRREFVNMVESDGACDWGFLFFLDS